MRKRGVGELSTCHVAGSLHVCKPSIARTRRGPGMYQLMCNIGVRFMNDLRRVRWRGGKSGVERGRRLGEAEAESLYLFNRLSTICIDRISREAGLVLEPGEKERPKSARRADHKGEGRLTLLWCYHLFQQPPFMHQIIIIFHLSKRSQQQPRDTWIDVRW